MLPMGQDGSTLALIKAQIERLPRTPGVPGGKGTPQARVGAQRQRFEVGNRGCLAPEQAPVCESRYGTQHAQRPLHYWIMRRTNVGMSRRRSLVSTPGGRLSLGSDATRGRRS